MFGAGSRVRRTATVKGAPLVVACLACLGLASAAPTAPAAVSTHERWSWPSDGAPSVTRPFDPPSQPWLSGHRGVDLGIAVGSQILAPAEGTVIFSGSVAGRGVLSVMHEGGLRSTYEPVEPLVVTGQTVARGQAVAVVQEGHHPGPLHWGARYGEDEYVNPLRFVVGPSVLKSWSG